MKKSLFAVLILVATLTSCMQDPITNPTSKDVSVTSLPASVTEYVANNYPGEYIAAASKVNSGELSYLITLNTTEQLTFDLNGDFTGAGFDSEAGCLGDSLNGSPCDSMPHDSLGGHPHHGGGHHGGPGHHGHGGPHGGPGAGNGIPVDSLPAAIAEYMTLNYAGYTAHHAEIDTVCQFGAVIELMAELQGTPPVKLFFDAAGLFLMSGERALYADAPHAVKDYVIANYAGYTVREKMEILTLADGTIEYKVYMKLDQIRKKVLIKGDGTFVCEQ